MQRFYILKFLFLILFLTTSIYTKADVYDEDRLVETIHVNPTQEYVTVTIPANLLSEYESHDHEGFGFNWFTTTGLWFEDESNPSKVSSRKVYYDISQISSMIHGTVSCTYKYWTGPKLWDVRLTWDIYPPIYVTRIDISDSYLSMTVGDTKQLTVLEIYPLSATETSVTWSSSDNTIATVSSNGLVTAKAAGTATITCKARDGSGVTSKCVVTVNEEKRIEINEANFPDENFRNYLLSQGYGNDGVLAVSEINYIWEINVSGKEIKSLEGIEHFHALTSLSCTDNQISSLFLSGNPELDFLGCGNNQLSALDVTSNTKLTRLICSNNKLATLDVTNNTELTELCCGYNDLSTLDISRNKALTYLSCYNNNISNLDISKCNLLESLDFNNNAISSIDLTTCTKLLGLYCNSNKLSKLDVSKCKELKYLECDGNQLSSLDLSKNSSLLSLFCRYNHLPSLIVSREAPLTSWFFIIGNRIRGEAMDAFINSLPVNNSGEMRKLVVRDAEIFQDNICTKEQVAAAKAKGWLPTYYSGFEYKGIDELIAPESITIPSAVSVAKGETAWLYFYHQFVPANATAWLTWTSDNENIATVDENGIVTGVEVGMTFINVTTDNGLEAYCKLTVTEPGPVAPTNIEIPKTFSIYVGEKKKIEHVLTPANAVTTVEWEIDDSNVASIDSDGVLEGKAVGMAFIKAKTANGLTSNTCKLTVLPKEDGIDDVKTSGELTVPVFSLSGQQLAAPRKGINITGGKKIVVK